MQNGKTKWLMLVASLVLSFGTAASGVFVEIGGWYAALNKPSWNPPGWLFGPVWSLLYILMAIAAWRVWLRGGFANQRKALGLYLAQLVLNAAWTPLFFGAHEPGWAFVEIVALWIVLAACVIEFRRVDRTAWALMLPYIAWVSFAAFLNFTIWRMNA
jgi:translocator protein